MHRKFFPVLLRSEKKSRYGGSRGFDGDVFYRSMFYMFFSYVCAQRKYKRE